MSQDTPEPEWLQMARQLGGLDVSNNFRLNGLWVLDSIDPSKGTIRLQLITPLRAGLYDEELCPKNAPVRFDRDEAGMVIIPGRWFLAALEAIRDDPQRSAEERNLAATARRYGIAEDGRVAADRVQCLSVLWPQTGESIDCEVLPPPQTFRLHFVNPED